MNHNKLNARDSLGRALLPYLILSEIHIQPDNPYQLIKRLKKKYDLGFYISTFYTTIKQLYTAGYLKYRILPHSVREQKVYSMTPLGYLYFKDIRASIDLLLHLFLTYLEKSY